MFFFYVAALRVLTKKISLSYYIFIISILDRMGQAADYRHICFKIFILPEFRSSGGRVIFPTCTIYSIQSTDHSNASNHCLNTPTAFKTNIGKGTLIMNNNTGKLEKKYSLSKRPQKASLRKVGVFNKRSSSSVYQHIVDR